MSRVPVLLAALGGVTFGFGLLSLAMAFFQPLMPRYGVYGNLALGVVLLAAAATWSFDELRDRMRSGGGRRRGLYGTSALFGTTLGIGILAMLAFLSTRYTERFDWTEQGVNTLTEQTRTLLAGLEEPVQLLAFFREQDSARVRDLLDRYEHQSERVRVRFVDPNRRPDLVEAHALDPADLARGLVLVTQGDAAVQVDTLDEPGVTNAIARLARRESRKVYFLQGHNERKIEPAHGQGGGESAPEAAGPPDADSAAGRGGFARAAAALRNETYTVEPLLLASREAVPEDANVVVVAGPTRPFFEGELAALEDYVARGGALLVLIDPRAQTNLYPLLERWGVVMGDDVVVDPVQSISGQPTAPLVLRYAEDQPIGASLGRTVFPMARSVTPAPGAPGLAPLVFAGESSWAERDIDGWLKTGRAMLGEGDLQGPVPLAVAGTPRLETAEKAAGGDAAPRLVAIGDSSFATNEYLDAVANRDLLLNCVSWLLGDVDHIAVRPHVARSSSVVMTERELQAIVYVSLFALPEGIALAGVLSWWSRRRRG